MMVGKQVVINVHLTSPPPSLAGSRKKDGSVWSGHQAFDLRTIRT